MGDEQTATMRAVILLAVLCCAGASHYGKAPCQSDETSFLINADQGASVCAAKCGPEEQCPEDTPAGTKAKPRCALRDNKGTKYCAITCFLNGKCPPTAECTRPAGAIIGYCAYPNATVQESNLAVTPLEHVDVVPNKAFAALIDSWTSVVDSTKGGCAKPGACGLVYQGWCLWFGLHCMLRCGQDQRPALHLRCRVGLEDSSQVFNYSTNKYTNYSINKYTV